MIAQSFEFTRNFPNEWNNSVYFRLTNLSGTDLNSSADPKGGGQDARNIKISCGFKEQASACSSGEKCGLETRY